MMREVSHYVPCSFIASKECVDLCLQCASCLLLDYYGSGCGDGAQQVGRRQMADFDWAGSGTVLLLMDGCLCWTRQ